MQAIIRQLIKWLWRTYPVIVLEVVTGGGKYHIHGNPKRKEKAS